MWTYYKNVNLYISTYYVRNPGPGALGCWGAPGGREPGIRGPGPGIRGPGPGILGSRVWIPDSGVWGLDSGVSEGQRAWKSCAVRGFSPPLSVNSRSEGLRVRESSEVGGFSPPLSV